MLVLSFGKNFSGLPWTGFTFDWYRAAYAFDDLSAQSSIWRALFNSVWIGLAVAIIDTTLALLFSYGMARGQRVVGRPAILALCLMPLAAPPAAYGAAVLVFARRGPVTTDFGLHLVLLAHAVLFLPIAILFLLPRISAIAREILESSEDLGATGPQTLRRVVMPLARPALVGAFMATFLFSFNEPVVASWLVDRADHLPRVPVQRRPRIGGRAVGRRRGDGRLSGRAGRHRRHPVRGSSVGGTGKMVDVTTTSPPHRRLRPVDQRRSATGSRPMAPPASPPSPAATTSTSRWPAPGRTAR